MDGEALLGSSINDLINTRDEVEDLNTAEIVKTVDISEDTSLELEDAEDPDCGQEADLALLASLETEAGPGQVSESLVSQARQEVGEALPQEAVRLNSLLTELQEDSDNTRSLIQETYHSYRAILEQCMNNSLAELDKRHHSKELAIMEKLEEIDKTKRQLEMSLLWHDKSNNDGQKSHAVSSRMESLMKSLQNDGPKDLAISLDWSSDKEIFTRALSENFGHFHDEKLSVGAISRPLEVSPSPKLLVSEAPPPTTDPSCLVTSLLSPEPPGLLTLGPLSPLGSGLSSPAHFSSARLGLSQPDLAHQHQQSHNSNMEYSLSHLSTSGPITSRPGFTLAELISNVSEDVGSWETVPDNSHPPGPSTALNNLAALAKLDTDSRGTSWPPPDPSLLLPDLGRDITRSLSNLGSDASPGNHSLSPVLGLSVPQRGTSPMSPIDSLMPGLGSLSLSPSAMMRSPGSNVSQQRNLNSMQIRCKFGQLGPGKGQFNSPHGFCLGIEEEIIVADTNNHRIQVFEKNGTYRYQFGVAGKEEGQLWYPRKVAVMKSSGKFVVCDRGNERSRMQIFTKHGHFVRKIAIRYIDIVAGLAITREGNIVAVDSVTPTIFVILEHGELLRWFDCADYMREPSDIAVAGTDFYVCDFKGHNVVVFTEEGQFLRRIGCENITNFPNDAGDILIGDSHGNKFHVVVFSNDGTLLGEFECPHVKVSRCCGLKITSEGYVVTLAKNNHHVLVLNTLYIA